MRDHEIYDKIDKQWDLPLTKIKWLELEQIIRDIFWSNTLTKNQKLDYIAFAIGALYEDSTKIE